mmetsp:Transcript_8558/g.18047  ORF Transcript_8558/g.18047 Transcript_8558/m.18047 type:complete len:111 (-) Transcript_8558:7-339(-)
MHLQNASSAKAGTIRHLPNVLTNFGHNFARSTVCPEVFAVVLFRVSFPSFKKGVGGLMKASVRPRQEATAADNPTAASPPHAPATPRLVGWASDEDITPARALHVFVGGA